MQIHVHKDGQQFGPYTLEQLREYVQQGYFTDQDHACHDGQNWVTIAQVPGYAGGVVDQVAQPQAAAPQAQVAAQSQAQQTQVAQTAETAAGGMAKAKILILSGVALFVVLAGVLTWVLWPEGDKDDDAGGGVASAEDEDSSSGKGNADSDNGDSPPSSSSSSSSFGLAARVPSNAFAIGHLDLKQLLDKVKSSSQSRAMLSGMVPPHLKEVFEDPSSAGVDLSEPVLAYFLINPKKMDHEPIAGFAAKVSSTSKLKDFLESHDIDELAKKKEFKDGLELWEMDTDEHYFAFNDDLLVYVGCDGTSLHGTTLLVDELTRFVNADGSDSFAQSNDLDALYSQKHDIGFLLSMESLNSFAEAVAEEEDVPEELLKFVESGSIHGGLRFDAGEVVFEFSGQAENFPDLGGGGISSPLAKFLSADALGNLSVSFNLQSLAELAATAIESQGGPGLDDPVPNLGFKPREVLDVFKGGFAISLTGFSGFSAEEEEGGFPPDGPEGQPAGMNSEIPIEFLLAASIDSTKFQALLTNHPPVAGVMGMAALAGVTVQPVGDALVVATAENKEVAASGGFSTPLSGSTASLFKEHDLVLRVGGHSITEWARGYGPEGALAAGALSKLDGFAITADSAEGEGSLSLHLTLKDKNKNSLAALVEIIAPLAAMMGGGGGGPDHDHGHGPDHEPDF